MAHILVLEPDAKLAQMYAQVLQTRQHTTAVAHTAQDAVSEADAAKPDAVVLELQLTSHSGIEFLYEFRSYTDWREVPVIVLSNVPPTEFAASQQLLYQRLGVTGYYYKPRTSLKALLRAVEETLTVCAK